MKRLLDCIKNRKTYCIVAASALGGVVLTLLGGAVFDGCTVEKFAHINPRFACGVNHSINKGEYRQFRIELEETLEDYAKKGYVTDVSVFFRDLEAGPTFGINEWAGFIPASLLKLPQALALYELQEDRGNILEQKVTVPSDLPAILTQHFPSGKTIEDGKVYSVRELVSYTLSGSDNRSYFLLNDHISHLANGTDIVQKTMLNLGIIDFDEGADIKVREVTVRGYASLFRQLYNVSFISAEHSEELLAIMSENSFTAGLRQGIPQNIEISHKFGERFLEKNEKQLHDCGIVYYPGNPYLLCVMTRGKNFDELSQVIGTISKEVYDEVDSRRL